MSAVVKLPRRLPDFEPECSDPPSEADWLRRAIRCIEHWVGSKASTTAWIDASACACAKRGSLPEISGQWLPEHLRWVPLAELRQRLTALEAEDPTP